MYFKTIASETKLHTCFIASETVVGNAKFHTIHSTIIIIASETVVLIMQKNTESVMSFSSETKLQVLKMTKSRCDGWNGYT